MDYKSPFTVITDRPHGFTPKKININTDNIPPEYRDYFIKLIRELNSYRRPELWEEQIEKLVKEIEQIESNKYPFLYYDLYSDPNYMSKHQKEIDKLILSLIIFIEPGKGISKLSTEFKNQILYYYNLYTQPKKEEVDMLLNRIRELYDEKLALKRSNDVHYEAMLSEFIVDLAHQYTTIGSVKEFRKVIIPALNPTFRT